MPATSTGPGGAQALSDAVLPVIEGAGLVLEDADIAEGNPPVVRLVVDRPDGTDSVGLDQIAELTGPLGDALDASVMTGDAPYELEVSSPGASRPLTQPRHWVRNVGRMVKVSVSAGEDVSGLLLAADEDGVDVEPVLPPAKKGMRSRTLDPVRLVYADIRRGKVDIEATAARQLKHLDEEA